MRDDVLPFESVNFERSVTVALFTSATFVDLMENTAGGGYDLSPYVSRVTLTHHDLNVTLKWHDTLLDYQPRPGNLVQVVANGRVMANYVVDTINEFREQRGNRLMAFTARSRESVGKWKRQKVTTDIFPKGTQLSSMIRAVLVDMGLAEVEMEYYHMGYYQPHDTGQVAEKSAWEILEMWLKTQGLSPMVEATGKFKARSRDITREADLTLTHAQVLSISGSKMVPSITAHRLRWLDPELTLVTQQDQILGTATMTAGFFKHKQKKDMYFSEDRTQRAKNTYMKKIASVNDGLLPVGSEHYDHITDYYGKITVTTDRWVPGLATTSLAAMLALDEVPDGVVVAGMGASTGYTIPEGRIIRGVAEGALLITMMSLGTGQYEVWGQPYDYVHERNTTEAYNSNAPDWLEQVMVEENDFIGSEAHAQQFSIRELLYNVAAANTWGVVMADDPRVEEGDIIALPDNSRLYVTGYTRDLSPGAKATLKLEGFRV